MQAGKKISSSMPHASGHIGGYLFWHRDASIPQIIGSRPDDQIPTNNHGPRAAIYRILQIYESEQSGQSTPSSNFIWSAVSAAFDSFGGGDGSGKVPRLQSYLCSYRVLQRDSYYLQTSAFLKIGNCILAANSPGVSSLILREITTPGE